ncbi:MAG: chloride channel protein [Saprospiraceae bacterium]|nr:chloride channel protein [Saprospiraceae bacterium]
MSNKVLSFCLKNPIRTLGGWNIAIDVICFDKRTKISWSGIPTIINAFDQQLPSYDFALKLIFTVVTLAFGFKGGEVTPLFFIGATLGNAIFPFSTLPLDILAGMGFVGVFAGCKTPIACTIMAVELFGWESVIFVSIGCLISNLVSGSPSIYTSQKSE